VILVVGYCISTFFLSVDSLESFCSLLCSAILNSGCIACLAFRWQLLVLRLRLTREGFELASLKPDNDCKN
jgi:hypothetical protein